LSACANGLAAAIAMASIVYYAVVYSLWLKRRTPQNIVIGGGAGASAPLIAWAAMTGRIELTAVLLAAIVFLWTPPHFWALALYRRDDYLRANLPMLPVTHGEAYTLLHLLFYTLILIATTLLPFATGMAGVFYVGCALILDAVFLAYAVALWRRYSDALAKQTFAYSIFYLAMIFAALMIDHYLPLLGA
jgi:protoheme IX farnesyltransferase